MVRNKLRPVAATIMVLAAIAVTARAVGFDSGQAGEFGSS
jgi:hypothetical protein